MEANRTRNISNGKEYDHLFPAPEAATSTIRKNADVNDTVAFIPKAVHQTLDHTKKIAQLLKANSLYETCRNTWHFVYRHINYKKDQDGFEQIRSPARSWHDRSSGVDCDCYSVFISSILTNLGIPHTLRITKYRRDYFQHIYPIVPLGDGKHITIDCVTNYFNYEVPFSVKKDYPMDLQYLSGLDDTSSPYSTDAHFLNGGMGELGKIIAKKINQAGKKPLPKPGNKSMPKRNPVSKKSSPKKAAATPGSPGQKKPKKFLNIINKVNPATVMLRNGVLASMKLNIKNVAGRLRWSYLSPQQAASKNINPEKFQRLIATRQKLENIFFKAGGKPDNLRKAILGGKGNKDKAVNGLEGFDGMSQYADMYSPLEQLLGDAVYYSENIEGMEGFTGLGELGEPITLTTIAAASGVIAGIVAALKQIGDIFQKKTKGSEDFDEAKNEQAEKEDPATGDNTPPFPATVTSPEIKNDTAINTSLPAQAADTPGAEAIKSTQSFMPPELAKNREMSMDNMREDDKMLPATKESNNTPADDNSGNNDNKSPSQKEGFWDKNKSWLKPVAIGVGGLTILGIGFALLKGGKTKNKSSPGPATLSGVPARSKKNHYRTKSKQSNKRAVKTPVKLL